jgi:hypothetical protein
LRQSNSPRFRATTVGIMVRCGGETNAIKIAGWRSERATRSAKIIQRRSRRYGALPHPRGTSTRRIHRKEQRSPEQAPGHCGNRGLWSGEHTRLACRLGRLARAIRTALGGTPSAARETRALPGPTQTSRSKLRRMTPREIQRETML